MNRNTLSAHEIAIIAKWDAATPSIPGNASPMPDSMFRAAPECVVAEIYRDLCGRKPAKGLTNLADRVIAINEAIRNADARCIAARKA